MDFGFVLKKDAKDKADDDSSSTDDSDFDELTKNGNDNKDTCFNSDGSHHSTLVSNEGLLQDSSDEDHDNEKLTKNLEDWLNMDHLSKQNDTADSYIFPTLAGNAYSSDLFEQNSSKICGVDNEDAGQRLTLDDWLESVNILVPESSNPKNQNHQNQEAPDSVESMQSGSIEAKVNSLALAQSSSTSELSREEQHVPASIETKLNLITKSTASDKPEISIQENEEKENSKHEKNVNRKSIKEELAEKKAQRARDSPTISDKAPPIESQFNSKNGLPPKLPASQVTPSKNDESLLTEIQKSPPRLQGQGSPEVSPERSHYSPLLENQSPLSPEAETKYLNEYHETIKTALAQRMHKLTIQEVIENDWAGISKNVQIHFHPHFRSIHSKYKVHRDEIFKNVSNSLSRLWTFLKDRVVEPFERECFQNNICVTTQQFEDISKRFKENVYSKVGAQFSDDSNEQDLIHRIVSRFICEWRERNNVIISIERKIVQDALKIAGNYYCEEMSKMLGSDYCDPVKLEDYSKSIAKEIEDMLMATCEFKNEEWIKQCRSSLRLQVQDKLLEFQRINADKKLVINDKLLKLVERAQQTYGEAIKQSLHDLRVKNSNSNLSQFFDHVEKSARSEALLIFDGESKTHETNLVESHRIKLIRSIDLIKESKRDLVDNEDKSRATRRRQLEDDAERKKINSPLEEGNDKRVVKTKEMEKIENRQQINSTFPSNHSNSSPPPRPTGSPSGIPWHELNEPLQKINVVFHVGLDHTSMGYVDPLGQLHILGKVENVLYFQGGGRVRVAFNPAEADSFGCKIPFRGLLIKNPLDKLYDITTSGGKKEFRIEELISFVLCSLKMALEWSMWANVGKDCMIVVSQSLNIDQREAIRVAGGLAGFDIVTLINDTTAMALAFTMTNRKRNLQLVTANVFEGFLDVASFWIDDKGMIQCQAVTGNHFKETERGFLEKHFGSSSKTVEDHLAKSIKKVYTEKILKVNSFSTFVISCLESQRATLVNAADLAAQIKDRVDENYPLLGAAYLSAICEKNQSHFIYNQFRETGLALEDFQSKIMFRDPEHYKGLLNPVQGKRMSPGKVGQVKGNYFLKKELALHAEKMKYLEITHKTNVKVNNLKPHDLNRIRQELVGSYEIVKNVQWFQDIYKVKDQQALVYKIFINLQT